MSAAASPDPLITDSRQAAVREDWLDQVQEEILEPACRSSIRTTTSGTAGERYLLDDLLRDIGSGHDIRATVFVQCGAMYRADGPEELTPARRDGIRERRRGRARAAATARPAPAPASSASSTSRSATACAVLEAHMAAPAGASAASATAPPGTLAGDALNLGLPPPGPLAHPGFIAGAGSSRRSASARRLGLPHAAAACARARARRAGADRGGGPCRRAARRRALRRPPRRGLRGMAAATCWRSPPARTSW